MLKLSKQCRASRKEMLAFIFTPIPPSLPPRLCLCDSPGPGAVQSCACSSGSSLLPSAPPKVHGLMAAAKLNSSRSSILCGVSVLFIEREKAGGELQLLLQGKTLHALFCSRTLGSWENPLELCTFHFYSRSCC